MYIIPDAPKVDRKQNLNILYQVCVFQADRKNKMAARPLIGWYIFDFFSETAELNSTKLAGSKISTSSAKFVFFGPIGKTRWLLRPLIGWYIFDFFSETTEQNSMKLDRKQDLKILY